MPQQMISTLSAWSTAEREVMLLLYRHGWTIRQVAIHLGMSKSATSRIHRGALKKASRCTILEIPEE